MRILTVILAVYMGVCLLVITQFAEDTYLDNWLDEACYVDGRVNLEDGSCHKEVGV